MIKVKLKNVHLDVLSSIDGGDFYEAEQLAQRLATALLVIAGDDFQNHTIKEAPFFISKAEAKFIADKLLAKKTDEVGKTNHSGLQLMAKVLIPNKRRSNKQSDELWLARMAYINIIDTNESEFERVATFINNLVLKNNEILSDWKLSNTDSYDGYNQATPNHITTTEKLKKAYYKYKAKIEKDSHE
jgi:hypothetical protein